MPVPTVAATPSSDRSAPRVARARTRRAAPRSPAPVTSAASCNRLVATRPNSIDCMTRPSAERERRADRPMPTIVIVERARRGRAHHLPPAGAERHAHADLLRALRGQERHQAVDAHEREHQRNRADHAERARDEGEARRRAPRPACRASPAMQSADRRRPSTTARRRSPASAFGSPTVRTANATEYGAVWVSGRYTVSNCRTNQLCTTSPRHADHRDPRSVDRELESLADRILSPQ